VTPFEARVEPDFGIRFGPKAMTLGLEFLPKLDVVVVLSVRGDGDRVIDMQCLYSCIGHIDDGQSALTEPDAVVTPMSTVVFPRWFKREGGFRLDRGVHRRTNYRSYPARERELNIAFQVGCRASFLMAITPKVEEPGITPKEVPLPFDYVAAARIVSLWRGPVGSPR